MGFIEEMEKGGLKTSRGSNGAKSIPYESLTHFVRSMQWEMVRRCFVAVFLLLQLPASVLSFSLAPAQLERAGIGTRFVQRGCSSPLQLQVAALRTR